MKVGAHARAVVIAKTVRIGIRSTVLRAAVGVAVIGLVVLPGGSSLAKPAVSPVARPAAGSSLGVSVSVFILRNLAAGVLQRVGGQAFGEVLAKTGIPDPGAATLEALSKVDAKLDEIRVSLTDLSNKVDGIERSLAFSRLSAVRTSLRDLVGRVDDARGRLKQLTQIRDPTLRSEKRTELIAIIRDKLLTEQNTLNEAIDSLKGNDDIVHTAFLAERTTGRFWNYEKWNRAYDIFSYYRDEAAALLLLRVEYEYSFVKPDSTALYVAERKDIVQQMVDAQTAQFSRMSNDLPARPEPSDVIDLKPSPDGKLLVWLNDSRFDNWIFPLAESAPNQYQEKYPSLAEFHNLVSGRGSQQPIAYLRAQGFTNPLICYRGSRQPSVPRATETVFWTRDMAGAAAGRGARTMTAKASSISPAGTSECASRTPGSTSCKDATRRSNDRPPGLHIRGPGLPA